MFRHPGKIFLHNKSYFIITWTRARKRTEKIMKTPARKKIFTGKMKKIQTHMPLRPPQDKHKLVIGLIYEADFLSCQLSFNLLNFLNGHFHLLFSEQLSYLGHIKMIIWSWLGNCIERGQTSWVCWLSWLYTGGKGLSFSMLAG